jgi:hypothetical protein
VVGPFDILEWTLAKPKRIKAKGTLFLFVGLLPAALLLLGQNEIVNHTSWVNRNALPRAKIWGHGIRFAFYNASCSTPYPDGLSSISRAP